MQAIGLVPWVRRTANAAAVQDQDTPVLLEAEASHTSEGDQTSDQLVLCSGETESALLLIFDNRDGSNSWPLSKADDALLDGMLRAIGMSKATVCSCALLQDASVQGQTSLQTLCQPPRKHFLYIGGEAIAADTIDPIAMTQAAPGGVIDGWRIPSLAMLREAPQRKRQAWVTLKQLRSALMAAPLTAAPLDHN
ncbi:MAG: hypothetical protein V3U65_00165 [Granulosicoccaceae bacterium]